MEFGNKEGKNKMKQQHVEREKVMSDLIKIIDLDDMSEVESHVEQMYRFPRIWASGTVRDVPALKENLKTMIKKIYKFSDRMEAIANKRILDA